MLIVVVFLAGFLFCLNYKNKDVKEGFDINIANDCPNLLLQKGHHFLLFNTNKARIPGVNPIRFRDLEEYVQFLKWQRGVGIKCPVLYFQQTYDAQNRLGWRALKSPMDPGAGNMTGLPAPRNAITSPLFNAGTDDPPYNTGDYPAYDPENQYIGDFTPLDKMFHQKGPVSTNPMDDNYYPRRKHKRHHSRHYRSRMEQKRRRYHRKRRKGSDNDNEPDTDSKFIHPDQGDSNKQYHSFADYDKAKDAQATSGN